MRRISLAFALGWIGSCYSGLELGGGAGGDEAAGTAGATEAVADSGDSGGDADVAVSPSEVARITRAQYQRTIAAIFGDAIAGVVDFGKLPADGKIGSFASNAGLNVNVDSADAYRMVAEEIGTAAGAQAGALLGCAESDACVTAFVSAYGRRIYRRALSDAELDVFVQFWTSNRESASQADAMRMVVTAMLQTPDFLYLLEKGAEEDDADVRRLTGFELGARLSFFLWGQAPDDALLDAAAAGRLDDEAGLGDEVRRLLADARADETLVRFHTSWLGIDGLETAVVDPEQFPQFEDLRDDMAEETRRFVLHVFRQDDAQLATLFGADYSFASAELAAFYGAGVAGQGDDGEIALEASQRRGLLTHASYLTTHARSPERAPIYRGRSLLVDVFCNQLPPPDGVDTTIDFDSSASARQQIEDATSGPACAGCHSLINPLGYLFENYDAIGRWRTMDGTWPVEAEATILGTDIDGTYANAPQLLERLASSGAAEACVSRQWLRFALARPEGAEDEAAIAAAAAAAGGDMLKLVDAITHSDTFRHRRLPSE